MGEEDIIIADATGVQGNTSKCDLEESTDFCPVVLIVLSDGNPETIKNNSIIKVFQDSDRYIERCKPFITEMDNIQLPDNGEETVKYLVPYFRMWPSQTEDRIFQLACIVTSGRDNCAMEGDIYVEMPKTINGLSIVNLENNTKKNVSIGDTFSLDLLLTKDADRTPTKIYDVPLNFYAENKGKKVEVGRIHLSVALKDVFSKEETNVYLDKFKQVQDRINDSENYCLPAFREALETLLNIKANNTNDRNKLYNQKFNVRTQNYNNYVMHTYCNALSDIGVAKHFFDTAYNLNPLKTSFTYWDKKYEPSNMPTTMVSSVSEKCDTEVAEELGYHIFGVSLVNGSHVMSIVANNTTLNTIEFILSDYHVKGTNTYKLDIIDRALDAHSIGAWKYYFVVAGKGINKPNSKLDLWKIQNF